MKRIGIGLIKLYRIVFAWLPPSCRFEPTCSHYTEQAIDKYGLLKGSFVPDRHSASMTSTAPHPLAKDEAAVKARL